MQECCACGRQRPERWIDVVRRVLLLELEPPKQFALPYCVDRADCLPAAAELLRLTTCGWRDELAPVEWFEDGPVISFFVRSVRRKK